MIIIKNVDTVVSQSNNFDLEVQLTVGCMLSVFPDTGVSWKKDRREGGRQISCDGLACDLSTGEVEEGSSSV